MSNNDFERVSAALTDAKIQTIPSHPDESDLSDLFAEAAFEGGNATDDLTTNGAQAAGPSSVLVASDSPDANAKEEESEESDTGTRMKS